MDTWTPPAGTSVRRWRRGKHNRLYVSVQGQQVGWADIDSGAVTVEAPGSYDVIVAVVTLYRRHLREQCDHTPRAATRVGPPLPMGPGRPVAPMPADAQPPASPAGPTRRLSIAEKLDRQDSTVHPDRTSNLAADDEGEDNLAGGPRGRERGTARRRWWTWAGRTSKVAAP